MRFETVACPKQCGQRIIRKFCSDHIEKECPLENGKCKFKECTVTLPRNQLEKHQSECSFQKLSDSVMTSTPMGKSTCFDNAEIILCYKSDSDAISECGDSKTKEKYWKLSVMNLKDPVGALDSPLSKCRNAGCKTTTMYAELIHNHEKICCYKIEPCPNQKFGCTYNGNQYGLVSHQLKCEFAKANVIDTDSNDKGAYELVKEIEWTKNFDAKEMLYESQSSRNSIDY